MSAAFALSVKDAGTGECTVLRVAPTTTAAALKQRLLSDGIAPPASQKVHLAHNGRMLQDDETLEAAGLVLVPTVVMACVAPAPTAAPAPPTVNKSLDGWFTKQKTTEPVALTEQPAPAATAAIASGSAAASSSAAATAASATAATAASATAATAAAAAAIQPPRTAAPAAAATGSATQLPRTAIARAWDRAFPSLQDGPTPAPAEEEDEKMCRVCFCGEEEGRLFAPCHCKGTMRYV